MRALGECARLLPRGAGLLVALASPAAVTGGGGALAAAGAAGPSMQPLVRGAAALRRWVHSGTCRSAWQRHSAQQWQQRQQQWTRLQEPGGAATQLWLRRWLSDKPRTAKDLYAAASKKNTDQGWHILATAVAMIGVTYAAVPLYRMFCQATGYGGTVQEGRAVEDKIRRREQNPDAAVEAAAAAREVTVFFDCSVADGMPWRFRPTQRSVRLHPGQSTLAFYTAHNKSDKAITGVSTYNVAPQQAGQYFNKIQCFCFEEQKLRPGETIDMPVFFYIDPEYATDPKMKGINTITLSYTFFKTDEEDWAEEAEGAAASASPAAAALPAAARAT